MPLSRDPRNDRRRRVLRESTSPNVPGHDARSKPATGNRQSAGEDELATRRGAGYSQDVRKACSQRLVQLIPVRPLSFIAACLASLVVPCGLMILHYMIYVSGSLAWYGQPLAVALDASHPSSIAAWFGSHLWLLCLAATVLTFQLRRHKLDDYRGEYRLWFWLVLTCLLASVDSTTHLTELFGLAIDPWSRTNLGLSGPALTTSTLTVLIGMLGLRLCSELKSVPLSLICWLTGIAAWAGSGALAQEELQLKMTLQFRIWLKSALWIGGLTAVWLAALSYLRAVYREAQQRFLSRSRLLNAKPTKAASSGQSRDKRSPDENGRWKFGLPSLAKRKSNEQDQQPVSNQKQRNDKQAAQAATKTAPSKTITTAENTTQDDDHDRSSASRFGKLFRRGSKPQQREQTSARGSRSAEDSSQVPNEKQPENQSKNRFSKWLKPPKDDDDASEFQKVPSRRAERVAEKTDTDADQGPSKASKSRSTGGWFKRKADKQPATAQNPTARKKWFSRSTSSQNEDGKSDSSSKTTGKKSGGLFAKFKLQPPENSAAKTDNSDGSPSKNAGQAKQPATAKQSEPENNPNRPMTKAERRKMRRLQQKQNRAA